jgi:hypothetical protein
MVVSLNSDFGFNSYNCSFDAAFAPTSINLANELLEYNNGSIKVLVLELAPIEFMRELYPSHVARSVDWYNLDDFAFLLDSIREKAVRFIEFTRISLNRFYLLSYRVFSVGEFWKRLTLSRNNCESINDSPGPLPEPEKKSKLLQELNEIRDANASESRTSYTLILSSSSCLTSLEKKCQKRSVLLIAVVAPKMKEEEIGYIESLAKPLDQKNLIRLNNSDKYPTLYSTALTADAGHINEKGIPIFTECMSSSIRTIIQSNTINSDEAINL